MEEVILSDAPRLPAALSRLLPERLTREIEALPREIVPEEIRLRRDRCAGVFANGGNVRLSYRMPKTEAEELLIRFCRGSLYAHGETLSRGFLTLPQGVRVGVCGTAVTKDGRVTGITEPTAFCLRLPHGVPRCGEPVAELLYAMGLTRGVLVYAPPGVGKTTLLRALAVRMSGGERACRVVAVDTRGELDAGISDGGLFLDVLKGFPRGVGLEIAVRTLSPQLLLTDEIGDRREAEEILSAQIAGVPLLATAHAGDLRELLARPAIRMLHEARCFGAYVGISRKPGATDYEYDVCPWEGVRFSD